MKIDPNVPSTPDSASSLTGGARSAPSDASSQVNQAPASSSSATTASTAAAATIPAASAGAADPVNISTISAQLNASFASNTGDIDTKRVAELKDAMSKGNLSFDTSKIADGLLDTVRGLLQEPQQ